MKEESVAAVWTQKANKPYKAFLKTRWIPKKIVNSWTLKNPCVNWNLSIRNQSEMIRTMAVKQTTWCSWKAFSNGLSKKEKSPGSNSYRNCCKSPVDGLYQQALLIRVSLGTARDPHLWRTLKTFNRSKMKRTAWLKSLLVRSLVRISHFAKKISATTSSRTLQIRLSKNSKR